MMLFTAIAFLVLPVATEKLRLKLEPALDFHEAFGGFDDVLIFRIVQPEATNSCGNPSCFRPESRNNCPIVCGGSFAVDLSMYDGIEISFEAPEGQEIRISSNQETFRVRVEFLAEADCASNGFTEGSALTPEIVGSNVEALVANYNPSNSFLEVGKCAQGCSKCEIFTRVEFSTNETSFEGTISKITWSITYDGSIFVNTGEVPDFTYGTDGYTWIRTPFMGALVPASPIATPTEAPVLSPMEAPANTETPSSGADSLHSFVSVLSILACFVLFIN